MKCGGSHLESQLSHGGVRGFNLDYDSASLVFYVAVGSSPSTLRNLSVRCNTLPWLWSSFTYASWTVRMNIQYKFQGSRPGPDKRCLYGTSGLAGVLSFWQKLGSVPAARTDAFLPNEPWNPT